MCLASRCDNIIAKCRHGAVTAFASDNDFYGSPGCEYDTVGDSDFTFFEAGNVMQSIYLINAFQTPLLNHWLGPSWPFFPWLEQKSHSFALGDLASVSMEYLSRCQKYCGVTVMAAHVRVLSLRFVRQLVRTFIHQKPIEICSNRNHSRLGKGNFYLLSAVDIYYEAGHRTFLNVLILDTEGQKGLIYLLLGFEFLKSAFRVHMQVMSNFNDLIDIATCFAHNFKVFCFQSEFLNL